MRFSSLPCGQLSHSCLNVRSFSCLAASASSFTTRHFPSSTVSVNHHQLCARVTSSLTMRAQPNILSKISSLLFSASIFHSPLHSQMFARSYSLTSFSHSSPSSSSSSSFDPSATPSNSPPPKRRFRWLRRLFIFYIFLCVGGYQLKNYMVHSLFNEILDEVESGKNKDDKEFVQRVGLLAWMYGAGYGAPQSFSLAKKYMTMAAELGDEDAKEYLPYIIDDSTHMSAENVNHFKLMKAIADGTTSPTADMGPVTFATASRDVALLYCYGKGVEASRLNAIRYAIKAITAGSYVAFGLLAVFMFAPSMEYQAARSALQVLEAKGDIDWNLMEKELKEEPKGKGVKKENEKKEQPSS